VHIKFRMEIEASTIILCFVIFIVSFKSLVAFRIAAFLLKRFRIKTNNLKRMKFDISVWKFLCYSIAAIYGISSLVFEQWIWNYKEYLNRNCYFPVKFRIYYFFEISFYLSELIALLLEPKKKDFGQMLIHHIFTLLLLCISHKANFFR